MKPAQVGGAPDSPAPVQGRSEKERVWRALVDREATQRKAAELAGCSRWKVRDMAARWVAQGWLIKRQRGGYRPTSKAPKDLRPGWAVTPSGSPLNPHAPFAHRVGDPARIHRGKLRADLARDVDPSCLSWWEGCRPGANGVVYHRYVLPCKTSTGLVGVPMQVIQPKRLDRPWTLIIQSANVLARESALIQLSHAEVLEWVRTSMDGLLRSWLGDEAQHLGALAWTGLDREDLEVAWEAQPAAQVGGDPQRDFAAVDKSDRFTPWDKEEEQNLTAYLRLRQLEQQVQLLEGGQNRIVELLERILPATAEQLDGLAAALEVLAKRGV